VQQKQLENEAALRQLSEHLDRLDRLQGDQLHLALAKGLLAGNVFDWGALEVRKLLETGNFHFLDALDRLQGMQLAGTHIFFWSFFCFFSSFFYL
jgi:type II pantothenate kinase